MQTILLGVVMFTVIVLTLVAVILLARRQLVASGNITININGEKQLSVPAGGKLLQTLAEGTQVLCVTHLAQVAAQGAHHLQVTKTSSDTAVETELRALNDEEKIQEIARMLGGVKITPQTLAHAREMLES